MRLVLFVMFLFLLNNGYALTDENSIGQTVYEQNCVVCHRDGVLGAPQFRDEASWKPHLSHHKDIDDLVAAAIKGKNAMPPKGTCQGCTDSDIKAAIEYMMPQK